MSAHTKRQITFIFAVLAASALSAGEIRLRGSCTAKSSVICLGDVADIREVNDASVERQLRSLPMFPAPRVGLSRKVSVQDVRETLSLYGLSMPSLRITGEAKVEGADLPVGQAASPAIAIDHEENASLVSPFDIATPIADYLRTKDRLDCEWKVTPVLTGQQTADIESMQKLEVTGGQVPWTGRQAFTVRDAADPASKPVFIKADVERTAKAIVTTRALAAGDVIREDDIELKDLAPQLVVDSTVRIADEAIGREVKKAMPAGQVLSANQIRKPIIVRRGELVTVYSIAAGVQIKAKAKATGDSGLGDLVQLESIETGKKIQARVTAPQEAMVFVDSPKVAATAKVESEPTRASSEARLIKR